MAQQPPVGQDLFIVQASRSQSDTPYSVGLLWTSDQPAAETTYTIQNSQSRLISMLPVGFEPASPAVEPPHTDALDREAIGIVFEVN
jgi:hypothetical protein